MVDQVNPKLMDIILSKIKNNEPIDDILANYSPYQTRDILESIQGEISKNKHPLDYFENADSLKNIPVKANPRLKVTGEMIYKGNDPLRINVKDLNDKGTLIHEYLHANDIKNMPDVPQPIEMSDNKILKNIQKELDIPGKIKVPSDLKGMDAAKAFFKDHFKPDVEVPDSLKQEISLRRMIQNKGLKSLVPLAKATGVGALGLSALGVGQKAMAGDLGGASLDAADVATDLIPGIGQLKSAIRPSEIGTDPLEPVSLKGSVFEKEYDEKFKKLKAKLNQGN